MCTLSGPEPGGGKGDFEGCLTGARSRPAHDATEKGTWLEAVGGLLAVGAIRAQNPDLIAYVHTPLFAPRRYSTFTRELCPPDD